LVKKGSKNGREEEKRMAKGEGSTDGAEENSEGVICSIEKKKK